MENKNALVPVNQEVVDFYGDKLTVALVNVAQQEQVFVPIRPICDFLGIAWTAQRQRINRDPVLSQIATIVIVTITTAGATATQRREMICLPLDYLNGFLFGINANRVKAEVRDNLIRYQRECYRVLAEAFREGRLVITDDQFDELLMQTDNDAVQAYKMALAVVKLARNQVVMQATIEQNKSQIAKHESRLEQIEATLGHPDRHITPEEASQISQAVKAVALVLSKQTGRNEYGGVYGELYRKFGITSYKLLPTNRFQEAMDWLNEWRISIEDDIPF